MENDTGSWRLFTELAVQPNPHYPTLNYNKLNLFFITIVRWIMNVKLETAQEKVEIKQTRNKVDPIRHF